MYVNTTWRGLEVQNLVCNFKWNYLRIDCYFCAHMEYKRPGVGLKIPRSALALLGKFSNLALHGIFKPTSGRLYSICARKSNQSLYLHFLHLFKKLKPIF